MLLREIRIYLSPKIRLNEIENRFINKTELTERQCLFHLLALNTVFFVILKC